MSFTVPAEWAPHRAMWLGFPSHAELWEDDLAAAQGEVAALAPPPARAGGAGGGAPPALQSARAGPGGRQVRLLTGSQKGEADARALLGDVTGIEIVPGAFGDIWLRDTG